MTKKTVETNGKPLIIAIEGINGSGKSTLIKKLHPWLQSQVTNPVILSRQVGGTALGEKLRDCMHMPNNDPITKVLIAAASMHQQLAELPPDAILLTDRWVNSTFAYQGYGEGIDIAIIADLFEVIGIRHANHTINLHLSVKASAERSRYKLDEEYLERVVVYLDEDITSIEMANDKIKNIGAHSITEIEVFNESAIFLAETLGINYQNPKISQGDKVKVTGASGFETTRVGVTGEIILEDDERLCVALDNGCTNTIDKDGEYVSDRFYLKVEKIK